VFAAREDNWLGGTSREALERVGESGPEVTSSITRGVLCLGVHDGRKNLKPTKIQNTLIAIL
jgi:hypothetical protein